MKHGLKKRNPLLMNDSDWIKFNDNSIDIRIYVQPRSSKNEIAGIHGDAIKIKITSPPVDGAANSLLIKFLSKKLGVSKSSISLVSGDKSRKKVVNIEGLTKDIAESLLLS